MRVAAVIAGAVTLVISATPALAANPSPSAQAPTPDRRAELAHRYVTAMHMDQTMRGMFKTLMPQMMSQMPAGGQLSDEQRKVLGDVTTEVMSEMMTKMMARMEPIMAEVYSEQELTDIVAFYESPTGQSALAKAPLLAQKMAP